MKDFYDYLLLLLYDLILFIGRDSILLFKVIDYYKEFKILYCSIYKILD